MRVAFQSDREGDPGIFWQLADGSGAAERLTKAEPGTFHVPESSSPDGEYLLFRVTRGCVARCPSAVVPDDALAQGPDRPGSATARAFRRRLRPTGDGWPTPVARGTRLPVLLQPFPPTGVKTQVWANGVQAVWSKRRMELFAVTLRSRR